MTKTLLRRVDGPSKQIFQGSTIRFGNILGRK